MEWLSQDFQGLHFDTQAINETSSSWGLIRRTVLEVKLNIRGGGIGFPS